MNEVATILLAIEEGDPRAAEQLLPLVYDELRRLAAAKLAQEKPGHTLQATALVHEAYLRMVDVEGAPLGAADVSIVWPLNAELLPTDVPPVWEYSVFVLA